MNYIETCGILGLEPNFSEEDYKKKIKELARKYHPDNFSEKDENVRKKMEEEMKRVNAAKSYFDTCYKKFGTYHIDMDPNYLNNYRDSIYKKACKYAGRINDAKYRNYASDVEFLVMLLEDKIYYMTNIKDITDYFNSFKENVKSIYDNLKKQFLEDKKLTLPTDLNYEVSIDVFFRQLVDYYEKFIAKYKARIKEVLSEYEFYTDYEILKPIIEQIGRNALIDLKNKGHEAIDDIIKEERKKINEAFDLHFKILQKIKDIKEYIERKYDGKLLESNVHSLDVTIYQKIILLETNYKKGTSFSDVEKKLSEIEKLCQKRKKIEENSDKVKKVFLTVSKRFYDKIREYNEEMNTGAIEALHNLYGEFIKIYDLLNNGNYPLEQFLNLDRIEFKNIEADRKILGEPCKKEDTENIKFYVRLDNDFVYGSNFFYHIDDSDNCVTLRSIPGKDAYAWKGTVPKEKFKKEFILLTDFLEEAKFYGKTNGDSIALYSFKDYVLVTDIDGNFEIRKNSDDFKWQAEAAIPYQDKNYMKKVLLEWISEKLEEYANKKEKMSNSGVYIRRNQYIYGTRLFNCVSYNGDIINLEYKPDLVNAVRNLSLTLNDLAKDYILLEEFVNKGEFVGKTEQAGWIALYKYSDWFLCLNKDGSFEVRNDNPFYIFKIDDDSSVSKFKNKNYMIAAVEEWLSRTHLEAKEKERDEIIRKNLNNKI